MIDLTPLDVRKKKEDFKRSVRGYDPPQVDAFLEVVADRLEQLVREHGSLSERLGHLETSLETYQERERALNEALLAAQELREEARSQAERDASVRLREAENHAEAILLDADQAIRHSQRRMEDLRARRRQFLKSLRGMMERLDDYLELEETRLDTETEDLGDLLERLQTDVGDVDRGSASAPVPPAAKAVTESAPEPPAPAPSERLSFADTEGSTSPDAASETEPISQNGDPRSEDISSDEPDSPAESTAPTIPASTPIAPVDIDGPGETSS